MAEAKKSEKKSEKPEKPAKSSSRKPDGIRSGNPAKRAAQEREREEESRAAANRVSRTPTRIKGDGSPGWYAPTMVGIMLTGLLWMAITYIFKGRYPLPYFVEHHASDWMLNGNLYIGALILLAGFLGILRWK